MKLFDAVGWQPATCSNKMNRMQLFDAVGLQPAAIKGLGCSYVTL